ncbi:hypothetical protein FOXG_06622 [Fusarium oxysporum f. sp. lycopersici 4287]|uniref:Uncharacterized protein n=1 Tax=Fusarium oxysporum f. sp. lycopersici (strain 4287 / CBS 123668 / FGSC 9935 / NRRL 34936) TaxID=426428 RepID=A0A0J9V061_FUSO4|nr:hypothetical protein FOXG_06622 [Fusarium oxysporum f. sp. lycopersici 4287]KAJ9419395.1 ankyrin repeat-containing domain protein [Fusarium oxysporum]KNB04558.1 hypothetical protein FOXG_06622 [Fusarium oxysporum f. sp. lycopersici 4287]
MSFGFSVGDFITVIELAAKIRKEFAGAPGQFKEITDQTRLLYNSLGDVDTIPDWELSSKEADELKEIKKGCWEVLRSLEKTLNKYTELHSGNQDVRKKVKKIWKRLMWEPDDIRDLRSRMTENVALLNAFYGKLSNETSRATKAGVDRLNQFQDNQKRREEDQKILNWLTAIDYTLQHNDFISQREEGTGHWLLESTAFQEWLETSTETLFALGMPGAGKTILTSIVVDELFKRYSDDDTIGIAYIYCNFQRTHEQKATDLLASLLKQLAQRRPTLPDSVGKMYKRHHRYQTRPLFDEISTTLQSVSTLYSRVFIVIDALDECQASGGCRSRLLNGIFDLQENSKAKIFATSRDIPEISEKFRKRRSLEIEIYAHDVDVHRYLDGNMFQMQYSVGCNPELEREIKTRITQSARGMFLLAQLLFDSLVGAKSPPDVRAALANLPTGTDVDIYDRVYKDAMVRIEGQAKLQTKAAKQVLSWIVNAKRPLTTLELQHALAVDPTVLNLDTDRLPQIEHMLSVCAGLVVVDKESNIIRLVHYTTQQYFVRSQESWFSGAKAEIATVCVVYLSFNVFSSGQCSTDVEFEERLQSYPFFDYAARNWGHHVRDISMSGDEEILALNLLESQGNISASSQGMLATKLWERHPDYSQQVPLHVSGLHLAAYFGLDQLLATLLWRGHSYSCKDSDGRTALSWAAESGYEKVVKRLLDSPIEKDWRDNNGLTPLSWAACSGHHTIVKLLLQQDVEPDPKDRNGETPLAKAACRGYEEIVELLLATRLVNPDIKYRTGETPLWWAAYNGHKEVVKHLLTFDNVNPDSMNIEHRTPLWAAACSGSEDILQLLLDKGANPDPKDIWDRSVLSHAAMSGHETLVSILLANPKVNPNFGDEEGKTPLYYATSFGHRNIVQALLADSRVDPESRTKWGRTPVCSAAENGHDEVLKLLTKKKIKLDEKDDDGRTPLWWAAAHGQDAVIKLFLQQGIDPVTIDNFGFTPLSVAAGKGHEAAVELLLAYNQFSLESQDKWGATPLFWATVSGHESVIELLSKEFQANRAQELDLAPLVKLSLEVEDEFVKFLLSETAVRALVLVTSQCDPSTLDDLLMKYPEWQYIASPLIQIFSVSSSTC